MKELSAEIVSGENPEEFAREMGTEFFYGDYRLYEPYGDLQPEFLLFVRRSDIPENCGGASEDTGPRRFAHRAAHPR